MANNMRLLIIILIITTMVISIPSASSQLTPTFYANSCPTALDIIRTATGSLLSRDLRRGAFLLRLFFHDCFVNGCDASILLDDIPGSFDDGEQSAPANSALLINLNLVDLIKTQVDRACGTGVVSCADILAVATRDAVVQLGGPTYSVPVGRRDSRTANLNGARNQIPSFSDNLNVIIDKFEVKGFTPREMVALSGAHSVGQARCLTFRGRIYNDTNIDPEFAASKQANCPRQEGPNNGDDNFEPLDPQSPNRFGNNYFQALLVRRGLLNSDQVLFNNGSTDDFVRLYAGNLNLFETDFANAMVKMGNLSPLTGTQGEIRDNCGRTN